MNDWILPQVEEQVREIEKHQANKRREAENKTFVENMPSPNYALID